jgi:hypothetical protein
MAHISLPEAQAWLQATKLDLSSLESALEQHASGNIISKLAYVFEDAQTTWLDAASTPKLVRTLIAMYYASYLYDRAYADDATDTSNYAFILRRGADAVVNGLISGAIILEEDPTAADPFGQPAYFPTDQSSANPASSDFPSDGPPSFTMGQVF